MTPIQTKLLVGGLVLAVAVTYLAFAGVQKGWVYYVAVDEFAADTAYQAQRVRLTGLVAEEGMEVQPAAMLACFELMGQVRRVPVRYRGAIPDMFKSGAEVVVEGKMDGGVFEADTLLTKCASKYEQRPQDHVPVAER